MSKTQFLYYLGRLKDSLDDKQVKLFGLILCLTIILYQIPFGGYLIWPLYLMSTAFHELGHGLTAVLVGHDFHCLMVYADGSGVAYHSRATGIAQMLISMGGLLGPALFAALFFWVARDAERSRKWLEGLGICLAILAVLVVRNVFGFVVFAVMSAAMVWVARKYSVETCQKALVFLALQMCLSVYSDRDYLFTQYAWANQPSDVEQISRALFFPYWFWGGLIALLTLGVAIGGLWNFLRK